MAKRILSVLAGLATGVVVIFILEMLSQSVYPVPKGIDIKNKEALTEVIKNMPVGAFIMLLIGYAVGSFCGGLVASAMATEKKMRSGLIVGIFLTLSALTNLMLIPHPAWFTVTNLLVYIPFALFGAFLIEKLKKNRQ